jgi:hypothetical protein
MKNIKRIGMRGVIDEFTVLLVIGLIIIILAFIFLGGIESYVKLPTNVTNVTTTTVPPSPVVPVTPGEGWLLVGPENVEVWRIAKFGKINISYEAKETKIRADDKHLFNGLLFGSNKLEISATIDTENLIGAALKFEVDKTNGYGKLIIKVNNVVINESFFDVGSYTILINKSLIKNTNKIEIIPSSSGWKLWAPTVYDLKNVEFVVQSLYSKSEKFSFIIYEDESRNLKTKKGKITLDFQDRKGTIKITLNNNEIFNNTTQRSFTSIYFDQKYLKTGENIIEFSAGEDSLFYGDANLIFYYDTIRENHVEFPFYVNETEYKELNTKNGTITFNITKILANGGLSLLIQNPSGINHTIAYTTVKEGVHKFTFNSTHCGIGKNILVIKSLDNAVFYVNDIEVKT